MGAAFVGTSGNTETSTFGADFLVNRRWPEWRLTGTAGAVRASDDGEPTAERYSATLRGDRVHTSFLSLTAGEKAERDELATSQRFIYYPNFDVAAAYRSEAEITAQAAMNELFALKFGFLWRYSNQPVFGFEKTDTTTTASIVVGWRSLTPAP